MEDQMQAAIDRIVEGFDFQKAANAAIGCGLKYEGNQETISESDLRDIAKRICRQALSAKSSVSVSAGYLRAKVESLAESYCEKETQAEACFSITLEFVPVHSHTVYVDPEILKKYPTREVEVGG